MACPQPPQGPSSATLEGPGRRGGEFIGGEWFRFLRRQGIRRAIRIRRDTILDELRADEWFETVQEGEFKVIAEKTCVFGEPMRAAKRPHASKRLLGVVLLKTGAALAKKWWRRGLPQETS